GKAGGPEASIDEGRRVTVGRWENGRAVVRYRGTRWDAEPAPGCDPVPGEWTIARTEGSVLILERRTD
ncbi:MAG: hypothetical protein MJ061_06915, partial [Mailhella sp.]|nr:hypothetical protein [Mailhella sp.]